MKRFNKGAVAGIVILAWLALPAAAQETRVYRDGKYWIEETTGTLPATARLKVDAPLGSVEVRGGDRGDVSYVVRKLVYADSEHAARRRLGSLAVHAGTYGNTTVIKGRWKDKGREERLSAQFVVQVPRQLELAEVETHGGPVQASNLAGRAVLKTMGGSIGVDDIGGDVQADTAGGGIEVGEVGGDAELETAGGPIKVKSVKGRVVGKTAGGSVLLGWAANDVVLETSGGSIKVTRCDSGLRAVTAGGSIDVGDVGGEAVLETSGGSIRLNSASGPVRAETAGGVIKLLKLNHGARAQTAAGGIVAEFVGNASTFSESQLETSVGDVVVYLPENLPVTVRANIEAAQGHTIESDFPGVKVTTEGPRYGPRLVYGDGAINGGGPLLKIHTTMGNILLKKLRR